jgi:hypothetical protein
MLEYFGNSKIDDDDPAVASKHEIARLDVTEYDGRLLAVQVDQDVTDLESPVGYFLLTEWLAVGLEEDLEGFALYEFHDEVATLTLGEKVKDLGYGRMGETGQNVGFALKVLDADPPEAGVRGRVAHLFDGNRLFHGREAEVSRTVNGPHAPDAVHSQYLVTVLEDSLARQCSGWLEGSRSFF